MEEPVQQVRVKSMKAKEKKNAKTLQQETDTVFIDREESEVGWVSEMRSEK